MMIHNSTETTTSQSSFIGPEDRQKARSLATQVLTNTEGGETLQMWQVTLVNQAMKGALTPEGFKLLVLFHEQVEQNDYQYAWDDFKAKFGFSVSAP